MTKEKKHRELVQLFTECGMVSRSEHKTHKQIRSFVAAYLLGMGPDELEALTNTIKFLLYDYKREN